jgi:hypothetical protein
MNESSSRQTGKNESAVENSSLGRRQEQQQNKRKQNVQMRALETLV